MRIPCVTPPLPKQSIMLVLSQLPTHYGSFIISKNSTPYCSPMAHLLWTERNPRSGITLPGLAHWNGISRKPEHLPNASRAQGRQTLTGDHVSSPTTGCSMSTDNSPPCGKQRNKGQNFICR